MLAHGQRLFAYYAVGAIDDLSACVSVQARGPQQIVRGIIVQGIIV
jgi:hypothetical protein